METWINGSTAHLKQAEGVHEVVRVPASVPDGSDVRRFRSCHRSRNIADDRPVSVIDHIIKTM